MSKTLYKDDVAARWAKDKGISKRQAKKRISEFIEVMGDLLAEGYDIKLNKFFIFYNKILKEKQAINPITKEPMTIKATRTIHTKLTKGLKKKIQGGA